MCAFICVLLGFVESLMATKFAIICHLHLNYLRLTNLLLKKKTFRKNLLTNSPRKNILLKNALCEKYTFEKYNHNALDISLQIYSRNTQI